MSLSKINKLVLSGGGMRGCLHIGALKYLEEIGVLPHIECVAGTSIGSLVATLVVMSYSSSELESMIIQFDYAQYQCVDIYHILRSFGIDNFTRIAELIGQLFRRKNYSPLITFENLHTLTHKHLILNAVCLNTHQSVFFDHIMTPQMPVIVAIQASMSLPFIFGSTQYNGLTYIDGGLLNNFPIDLPIFTRDPETVLGLDLLNYTDCSVREIKTIDLYCIHLFSCLYEAYIKINTQPDPKMHIVHLKSNLCCTYDLMLGTQEKQSLISEGYQTMSTYCINHPDPPPPPPVPVPVPVPVPFPVTDNKDNEKGSDKTPDV
jgi:hypothetical protein